jgi:hypothetical protein
MLAKPWLLIVVSLAVAGAVVVALAVMVPALTSAPIAAAPSSEPTRKPTPAPSPSGSASPTPDPTPVAPQEPVPAEAAPQAPSAPKPAPAPVVELPAVIAMSPGAAENCGEFPSGQTVYVGFSWGARDGNLVDVYYAYTEGDVQATSGFVLHGAGLATTGSVQIPRTCPNGVGGLPRVTVKIVAHNAAGSATAYYWGL